MLKKLILLLFLLAFYVLCNNSVASQNPYTTVKMYLPSDSGGRTNPVCEVNGSIDIDDKRETYYRDTNFNLSITLINKDLSHQVTKLDFFGQLTNNFENSSTEVGSANKIAFVCPVIEPNSTKRFSFIIHIPKNADITKPVSILKPGSIFINYLQKVQEPEIDYRNNSINIDNNKPQITASYIEIISQCVSIEKTLYVLDKDEELLANYSINASDKEDEHLKFVWMNQSNMRLCGEVENEIGKLYLDKLTAGENISFIVKALDKDNGSSNIFRPKILFNSREYESIFIPDEKYYNSVASILFIIAGVSIILIGFIGWILPEIKLGRRLLYFKSKLYENIYENTGAYKICTVTIAILYIVGIYNNLFNVGFLIISGKSGFPLLFNSVYFYEVYIYFLVFLLVAYFNQCCFNRHQSNTAKKLWIFNSFFMVTLLYYLGVQIPQIGNGNIIEHMHYYYSAMTQVFATIIAIVIAVPSLQDSRRMTESQRVTKSHFVFLYGVILALSFFGLSSCVSITFTPLINNLSTDLPNLISIGVFELTLLLIPPAIASLYEWLIITQEDP